MERRDSFGGGRLRVGPFSYFVLVHRERVREREGRGLGREREREREREMKGEVCCCVWMVSR